MLFDFKKTLPEVKSEFPYMNEPTSVQDFITTRPQATFENLDFWIERTPEAIAILNAIITDIKSDGFRFEGGKQAINKAEEFMARNSFGDEWLKVLWDWIKFGDCYLWTGGIKVSNKISQIKDVADLNFDEDLPQLIRHIPANTVDIIHDGKRITKFRQAVQGRDPIDYSVQDVIHGALLPNKGKVYGFSPSQAALTEMNIMGYLKDYCGTFFKNGGVPDWMFTLPNEMAGSPNHKKLIEMLTKYKHPQRKHGNLVFAGQVDATQVGTDLDKIDISSLTITFTSILALAHNMPVSRVASLIGSKVKVSSGSDDAATEGYWSKISEHQDRWENWLNHQLFGKFFNVKIRFNRAWKTNEIKEQQRNQFAINNVITMNEQLSKRYNKQLTMDYIKRQLYIKEEDLEKGKVIEEMGMSGTPLQKDNLSNKRGSSTESMRDEKRKQVRPDQNINAKNIEYKKVTHNCTKDLFFEKMNKWVKHSKTRDVYFHIQNGILNANFATPDENFNLMVGLSELDRSELNDLKSVGKETLGVE
ncbi:MAG: hypothetical protein CL811_06355 [Colwelliaceae bacterium]|jgi:hypothetical protein|nr:hypothetical protein [Colwelliaceae bacterium]|tara:strand:+ start:3979 stop:5571 length:1593 start_codon:yes stop_codon:yes gene_type:complete